MTVFDFSDKAQKLIADSYGNIYSYTLAAIFCILLLVFIIRSLVYKKNHDDRKYVVGAVVFLIVFGGHFLKGRLNNDYLTEYTELKNIYDNHEYKIVEGVVHVIHLEPESGHDSGDIIEINNIEFEVKCYRHTLGYNKSIVFGGVLTEGTFARVFYYQPPELSAHDKIILRIDLLEEPEFTDKKMNPLLPCAG